EQPVASRLDDAVTTRGDFRVDHLAAERFQPAKRPFLVGLDGARIVGDIGGENRRESTFRASWPCGTHRRRTRSRWLAIFAPRLKCRMCARMAEKSPN